MKNFLDVFPLIILGLVFSLLFHFLWFFVSKKYNREKIKLKKLKQENPNESYSQKEYFIKVVGAYVKGLFIARYIFIIFSLIIFLQYL